MKQVNADTLLTCIVCSPDVRKQALNRGAKLNLFEPLLFPGHAMVWEAIKQLAAINQDVTIFHLIALIKEKHNALEPALVKTVIEFLDGMRAIDASEITVDIADKYLTMALTQALKANMSARLGNVKNPTELLKALDSTAAEYTTANADDTIEIHTPLLNPERYMPEQVKTPVGVKWMDVLTGGGLVEGTLTGVLMPTGGGKTLTATDIVSAQSKRGNHAVLFLYEQPVANDVTERLFCRMFDDRSIDFFRDTQYRDWPEADKIRYKSLSELLGPKIHVVDFTGKGNSGTNGIADIDQVLARLAELDIHPEYVLIDWFWPMVLRYCAVHTITDSAQVRNVATRMLDEASLSAKKWKTRVMIYHQLNTEKSRANPTVKPVITDAMEIRNFAYLTDLCFLAGNRDKENNVMWLLTDKNRRGQPQSTLGWMRGERGVIELAENMTVDFRGRFVDADHAIPEPEEEPYGGIDYI